MTPARPSVRIAITVALIAGALATLGYQYRHYITNPWTRDGQVRAQVVQIAPRVSGPIVELPIVDNQRVKAGDLLFRIDPRTFQAKLERARANLDRTRDQLASLESQVEASQAAVESASASRDRVAVEIEGRQSKLREARQELDRQKKLETEGATSKRAVEQAQTAFEIARDQLARAQSALAQSEASIRQAQADLAKARATLGAAGDENAQLRQARATVRSAELDLEFTEVRSPVDGYVTNLNLRLGSQAVVNQPALALIDTASYWVHGFFRETLIGPIRPGDRAAVTLMSYPDTPLTGTVHSIGWGIAQKDGSTGPDLLPNVRPTFEWIRLAQRVPVRVHLDPLPQGVDLRVGTTGSVLIMTGTAGGGAASAPALPKALQ